MSLLGPFSNYFYFVLPFYMKNLCFKQFPSCITTMLLVIITNHQIHITEAACNRTCGCIVAQLLNILYIWLWLKHWRCNSITLYNIECNSIVLYNYIELHRHWCHRHRWPWIRGVNDTTNGTKLDFAVSMKPRSFTQQYHWHRGVFFICESLLEIETICKNTAGLIWIRVKVG